MKTLLTKLVLAGAAALLIRSAALSQIPVEVFAGHEKTTVDLMFFRFFKNGAGENSRFLFFNRNRASVDYRMTGKSYLPQFGFTEAVSYNHPLMKGFAPVIIGQVFSSGVYPKAGIQYYKSVGNFTIFTWLVSETLSAPMIDYYLLTRYEPSLTKRLGLILQAELVNGFRTDPSKQNTFIQRLRIGMKTNGWQFGGGSDFTEAEVNQYDFQQNSGIFIRYTFK
jgi:hypothetical protein